MDYVTDDFSQAHPDDLPTPARKHTRKGGRGNVKAQAQRYYAKNKAKRRAYMRAYMQQRRVSATG